jgi:hypothetical protein
MLAELTAILAADLPTQEDAAKLSEILYSRCYTRSILDAGAVGQTASADLTQDLAAANRSRSAWVEGWRIDQMLDDGRIVARKNGAARSFLPGDYITHRGLGSGPEEGGEITVYVMPGTTGLQPSFYYAFGETIADRDPAGNTLRFYWNIQAPGAPKLMEALTRELNRFQLPFRFKCLNNASYFPRRDAAVLYIDRRYYPITAMLVERVHSEMRPWLNESTPLFAKPLAQGLALAEDPGDSFGKHRCAILADAMAASHGRTVEDRLAEVRRRFEERGHSLDSPWLNANSSAQYEYPFATA